MLKQRFSGLYLLAIAAGLVLLASCSGYKNEVLEYQQTLNAKYADSEKSPLLKEDIPGFEGLAFFAPDSEYKMTARFERTKGAGVIEMATSTDRRPKYELYGKAHFEVNGQACVLQLYRRVVPAGMPANPDEALFLPFNDLTNGRETYGGGRYIDVEMPKGETVVLDFNKCYNPYCAYNHTYSCPIPPDGNQLNVRIEAGVKAYTKAHH